MAALYGRMKGARGEVTRTGSQTSGITAKLETWEGSIRVELEADGTFYVHIGEKHGARTLIADGNVDTRQVSLPDGSGRIMPDA